MASYYCCAGVYKAFTKVNEGFSEKYNQVVGHLAGRTFESVNGMQLKQTDSTIAKVMKVVTASFAALTVLPIVALFVAKGAQNLYQCAWGKVTPATPVPTPATAAAAPVVSEQAARVPTPPAAAEQPTPAAEQPAPVVAEQGVPAAEQPAPAVIRQPAPPAAHEERLLGRSAESFDMAALTPSQTPREEQPSAQPPGQEAIFTFEEVDAFVAAAMAAQAAREEQAANG